MISERERRLEDALARFLEPVKGIPFEVVIRSLCNVAVEKFDPASEQNIEALQLIVDATRDACRAVRANLIERPRPNEVGNDMEPFIIAALVERGMQAAKPKTKGGRGKSTGYPDVRIATTGLPIYLEVKTYAAATHGTSQRSFYLSPADDPKVYEDGRHLLVGFGIVRQENLFWPTAFKIVDLYGLDCDMKAEFNSDNRRLYEHHRVLAGERVE